MSVGVHEAEWQNATGFLWDPVSLCSNGPPHRQGVPLAAVGSASGSQWLNTVGYQPRPAGGRDDHRMHPVRSEELPRGF